MKKKETTESLAFDQVKGNYSYRLSYQEALEGFTLMRAHGKGSRIMPVHLIVLTILTCVYLYLALTTRDNPVYYMLPVIFVILIFCIVYVPAWKNRRMAKQMSQPGASFRFTGNGKGGIVSRDGGGGQVSSNTTQMYVGDLVYVLMQDNGSFYCIPKKLLQAGS